MGSAGLVLGGFMGTGKTTVGRRVAGRLGLPFVDLDALIEAQAGRTVAELFAREGEEGFRVREARAVELVLAGPDAVVALGGGTLHFGDNRRRLAARFPIVILDADLETLQARITDQGGRPLADRAAELWERRRAGYLSAGVVVDTRGLTEEQVVEAVLQGAA